MSWKSEIITEINEGKKDALDHEIEDLFKVGTKIVYVENDAGELTSHESKIKAIYTKDDIGEENWTLSSTDELVILEDGHVTGGSLVRLYIMNMLLD